MSYNDRLIVNIKCFQPYQFTKCFNVQGIIFDTSDGFGLFCSKYDTGKFNYNMYMFAVFLLGILGMGAGPSELGKSAREIWKLGKVEMCLKP